MFNRARFFRFERFFGVFFRGVFSKTLRLKTTEMIFLKIMNKKEVLSLLIEKKGMNWGVQRSKISKNRAR